VSQCTCGAALQGRPLRTRRPRWRAAGPSSPRPRWPARQSRPASVRPLLLAGDGLPGTTMHACCMTPSLKETLPSPVAPALRLARHGSLRFRWRSHFFGALMSDIWQPLSQPDEPGGCPGWLPLPCSAAADGGPALIACDHVAQHLCSSCIAQQHALSV